jgi:predicted DNA-binding transcriptional regulator YafY
MARGDQLGRQWKILQMLIDAKTGKSVADIADRLACHTRTVYRDLIALQTAGFPIYDQNQGGKSLWFMLESRKSISMPLSMTELTAPDDFEIDGYLQSSFGVFHGRMTRVKIWLSPRR